MKPFELLIRNGTVLTPAGALLSDVAVAEGRIVALGPQLAGSAQLELDAQGLHLFPGLIDAHVHFNDPSRAYWEGFATGSRALAAGGGTLFFDMPLNASPPTLDAQSFALKLAAAQRSALVDFAFWGGLVPQNLERLAELAECGVVGFKAFMCSSGIEDFDCVDATTLRRGMKRAAQLKLPVAVHAESQSLTQQLTRQLQAQGQRSAQAFLDSRPVAAELEAIGCALELAGETGCALHIVHVSCGAGVQLVQQARLRGVDVSCETCPHYLTLTQAELLKLGAVAKCAPPLRSRLQQDQLWEEVLAGHVTTIGSDHSPVPPEMKAGSDFFKVWGGIASVQHTLALLLSEGYGRRQAPLGLVAGLLSERVARRFKLPSAKGQLTVGSDADIALVDLAATTTVSAEELFYHHPCTPYEGRHLKGRLVRTLLRGQTVFQDGKPAPGPCGRLVKPIL